MRIFGSNVVMLLVALACAGGCLESVTASAIARPPPSTTAARTCPSERAIAIDARREKPSAISDAETAGGLGAEEAARVKAFVAGIVLDDMLRRAPSAKREVDRLARRLAAPIGGRVLTTAVKGRTRALQKVLIDYGGDATRIKDLARNTIILCEQRVPELMERLVKHGARIKVIDPAADALGYGGVNATIMTTSGVTAEIQVSTPPMIYAKLRPDKARATLGSDQFDRIMRRTGLPSGRGRAMYERWRILPPGSAEALAIAAESRAYYRRFLPKRPSGTNVGSDACLPAANAEAPRAACGDVCR